MRQAGQDPSFSPPGEDYSLSQAADVLRHMGSRTRHMLLAKLVLFFQSQRKRKSVRYLYSYRGALSKISNSGFLLLVLLLGLSKD